MANKRLIDVEQAKRATYEEIFWTESEQAVVRHFLAKLPKVDAVEVVHGRWLYDSGSGKYFCSACDEYALSFKKDTLYGGDLYEVCLTDYCPNCGALMKDGDGNV